MATDIVEQIVQEVKDEAKFHKKWDNYGPILNYIQDVAFDVLSTESLIAYNKKASADIDECEDHDGILINGHYFDWKEAGPKKYEHLIAWCGYFNAQDQEKILQELIARRTHAQA